MWVIKSKESVWQLKLGEFVSTMLPILGSDYTEFKRVPEAEETIYAFNEKGVHLTLDKKKRVQIISIFRQNEVTYKEVQLLGRKLEDVKRELKQSGIETEDEDVGLWIEEAGVLLIEVDEIVDGIELYKE